MVNCRAVMVTMAVAVVVVEVVVVVVFVIQVRQLAHDCNTSILVTRHEDLSLIFSQTVLFP
jgi:hypothetical protein